MYILGYFFMAVAKVADIALSLYMWIIIIRAVLSWVSPDYNNPIVRFIHNASEPVLERVRSYIPNFGAFDFTPVAVVLGIYFLRIFAVNTLVRFAESLL